MSSTADTTDRQAGPRAAAGVAGLHHVALVSRDLARTADFDGRVPGLREVGDGPAPVAPVGRAGELGMRPVKRTNNFDDVGSCHWYRGVGGGEPLRAALTEAGLRAFPAGDFEPDAARFRAVGTEDPDGHPVLVASLDGAASYEETAR